MLQQHFFSNLAVFPCKMATLVIKKLLKKPFSQPPQVLPVMVSSAVLLFSYTHIKFILAVKKKGIQTSLRQKIETTVHNTKI